MILEKLKIIQHYGEQKSVAKLKPLRIFFFRCFCRDSDWFSSFFHFSIRSWVDFNVVFSIDAPDVVPSVRERFFRILTFFFQSFVIEEFSEGQ